MSRIQMSRCPAPARTEWGVVRCVVIRGRCKHPGHARWNWLLWPMAVVWAVRPWWPNSKGRAADKASCGPAGRGAALNAELDRLDGAA
jgi:hypothetical protein